MTLCCEGLLYGHETERSTLGKNRYVAASTHYEGSIAYSQNALESMVVVELDDIHTVIKHSLVV